MSYKEELKKLTIKDNFMFGAVMLEEENCRRFLELVLEIPIAHVEVIREKSIVYHPEYKGIRLDVYAKDEKNSRYNIEMQVLPGEGLEKRTRYYHSQIDMELLLQGESYAGLPDSYVIFICDFDPFGKGKYRYTFQNKCGEERELCMNDGCKSIFLSTQGNNAEEVPVSLVKFLNFVKADLEESTADFEDEFVKKLQKSICRIKQTREMEERYMILWEMLRDERAEGRAEGKAEGMAEAVMSVLEEYGTVPEVLQQQILSIKDADLLKKYLRTAIHTDSVEQFAETIQKL